MKLRVELQTKTTIILAFIFEMYLSYKAYIAY